MTAGMQKSRQLGDLLADMGSGVVGCSGGGDSENAGGGLDLSRYDDVKANSEESLGRLKGATDEVMPTDRQ